MEDEIESRRRMTVTNRRTHIGARTGIARALLMLAAVATAGGLFAASAAAAVPANTAPPTISGNAREGQTLTASNGTWTNKPTTFAYQWQRCGVSGTGCDNVTGATKKTYTVAAADADHTLRVVVTASNADGQASATSSATDVVSSAAAPKNTAPPTISGTAQAGEELSATNGTWTGGAKTFTYQWQRCDANGANCTDVDGATGRTYGVRAADVDHTLRVAVTAANASDKATAQSAPTAVVKSAAGNPPPPQPSPRANKAPRLTLLSGRIASGRVYVRFRVCDDGTKPVAIIERDSKPGVPSYTRRFSTVTAPNPCGVYARNWQPAPRFRHGRLTVTLQARDTSGKTSALVHKVFFR
jgi:hypothetical protein